MGRSRCEHYALGMKAVFDADKDGRFGRASFMMPK
ncbi:hypothetical protein MHY1_00998 [Methylovirgula sp. HY1]|nr:hypothetical protein MHY1_00998 [Methylovirgula sp. HY1]